MPNKLTIPLVALLALAAGLAVGYFVGAGDGEDTKTPPPVLIAPTQPDPAAQPRVLDPLAQSEASKPNTVAELIAAAEIPPVPSGDVEYTGTVNTISGAPIPGVTVTARPSFPNPRSWRSVTPEDRVHRELARAKWDQLATRTTVTDAEGRYKLTGLAGKTSYTLSAEADGWEFSRRDPRAPAGTLEHHFTGIALTVVEVTARLQDGSALEDARISYRSSAKVREYTGYAQNGHGELRLTPGEWTIQATSDDDWRETPRRYRSEPVTLTVEEGKAAGPVELVLKPTPSIRGSITLPAGFVRPSLTVRIQAGPPSEPPGRRVEDLKGALEGFIATEHGHTTYELHDVPPGRHRVLLSAGGILLAWGDVTTTGEDLTHDLQVQTPGHDDYIVMRVYGPDGSLLPDAEVDLTVHTQHINSGRNALKLVADDGSIWIERYDPDGTAEWYVLRVSHTAHGEFEARYEASSREVLEVRLERPAFLVLTVPNWDEVREKYALSWELVPKSDSGSRTFLRDQRQQTSPIKLGPVSPGTHELRLRLEYGMWDSVNLVSREVVLVAGNNEITESVPALHALTIRVEDVENAPDVDLQGNGFDLDLEFSKGVCVVKFLPAGTYALVTRTGEMVVSVTGDQEIVFTPRTYDCLRLDIRPEGGKIEGLGLRDDDKLIEVDGTELKLDQDFVQVQASFAKTSTTWVVLREGVRTEVTFDGTALYATLIGRDKSGESLQFHRAIRD
jgi:hypothetical protein